MRDFVELNITPSFELEIFIYNIPASGEKVRSQ
jgi:hypothetical protein